MEHNHLHGQPPNLMNGRRFPEQLAGPAGARYGRFKIPDLMLYHQHPCWCSTPFQNVLGCSCQPMYCPWCPSLGCKVWLITFLFLPPSLLPSLTVLLMLYFCCSLSAVP